jgi:hypothetical protein
LPVKLPLATAYSLAVALAGLALINKHAFPAFLGAAALLAAALKVNLRDTPCSAVCGEINCGVCMVLNAHDTRFLVVLELCVAACWLGLVVPWGIIMSTPRVPILPSFRNHVDMQPLFVATREKDKSIDV